MAFQLEASEETLLDEFARNQRRMEDLQRRQEELTDRIAEIRAQAVQPAPRKVHSADAAFRDAITRTTTFTISEIASHLAWTPARVRKYVEEWIDSGRVADTRRRFGKQKIYEYVPPEGPGKAFEAQQRLRAVPDTPVRGHQAVVGSGRQPLDMIAHKSVKAAVREAMGEGFTLEPKGDGHYTLVKGTERIPVPSTPKNPDGTAKRIRAQMRQTRSRQVVRAAQIAAARR
jgi:hypothetical protein